MWVEWWRDDAMAITYPSCLLLWSASILRQLINDWERGLGKVDGAEVRGMSVVEGHEVEESVTSGCCISHIAHRHHDQATGNEYQVRV